MNNRLVEEKLPVRAPASRVWSVFTNPSLTRKLGGTYETSWKIGDSIQWKSTDGQVLAHGIIQNVQPHRLLQ